LLLATGEVFVFSALEVFTEVAGGGFFAVEPVAGGDLTVEVVGFFWGRTSLPPDISSSFPIFSDRFR
jgi:hypothetical protein